METTDALITYYVASLSVLDLYKGPGTPQSVQGRNLGVKKKLVVSMEIQMNALKALQN